MTTANFRPAFNIGRYALTLVLPLILGSASLAAAQVCGDADGSGTVTVTDGVNVLRQAASLSSTCSARLELCDVDNGGSITVTDGVNVLRSAAGLGEPLSCGGTAGTI